MKVIKSGMKKGQYESEIMEFECTGKGNSEIGCGAILEINQRDIFKTDYFDELEFQKVIVVNGEGKYFTFYCPECGSYTDFPLSQWRFSLVK